MRRLLAIPEYVEDLRKVACRALPWDKLKDKTILITGGTGLVGSFLVDVLMCAGLCCRIVLLGRSRKKFDARFPEYAGSGSISFQEWDVACSPLPEVKGPVDYVLHLASNTHPVAYATDPIGTIATNVIALNSLLAMSADMQVGRVLFASSNEIYGENRGDVELFDERYCGYIDCNTLRAGYPESKRCGEALCQAYVRQRNLDCVIARLTRTYGPTVLSSDTKAISQFFNNAMKGEDIVLKSEGRQHYSYQYVADSVAGLLTVLLSGKTGEAYNIADESGDITLRELAGLIARQAGRKVVFELPNATETAGFSKATKALLDGSRIKVLGWSPCYDIERGVERCFATMSSCRC